MKTYKIKYYLRRLGLFGTLKHLLSKLNVLDFNTYEYLYENYYRYLKEDNYENELIEWYKCRIGENINPLENPKTFNEKIQWLKLNDYDDLKTIPKEAKDKLKRIKPINIGQASRISGVSPADIQAILIYLKMRGN